MGMPDNKLYVVLRAVRPADEADFLARVFDARVTTAGEARLVDAGRVVFRVEHAASPTEATRGVHFEIAVDNVNRFAEDVWNRGIKYASRPQNHADGLRRVGFSSPGEVRIIGVGPLKMDSTGAFPSYRPEGQA